MQTEDVKKQNDKISMYAGRIAHVHSAVAIVVAISLTYVYFKVEISLFFRLVLLNIHRLSWNHIKRSVLSDLAFSLHCAFRQSVFKYFLLQNGALGR